jgi:putative membrane protein
MGAKARISEQERLAIRAAIGAAEKTTAGEIFVVVAEASDEYRLIPVLWATLVALLVPLPFLAVELADDWSGGAAWGNTAGNLSPAALYLGQLAVFVVLALVLSLPGLKPLVVPKSVKRQRAHDVALAQFLAHGLHTTEARTGVLVFVSLFERYAEIVADAGIAARVEQAVWDDSLGLLLADIRSGHLAEGLIGAVGRAGAVLAEHFPPRPRDRNELPNDVILL